jgi:hypothetical protein
MRIKFEQDHDLVEPGKTTAFKAGDETTVTKDVGDKLVGSVAVTVGEGAAKAPAKKGSEGGD